MKDLVYLKPYVNLLHLSVPELAVIASVPSPICLTHCSVGWL